MLRYLIALSIGMAAYWLALSGYLDKPMLLVLGVISIVLVAALVWRMKIADEETVPYGFFPLTFVYFTWLFREIAKANIDVIKAVLKPELDVTPGWLHVKATPQSDMGKTMFANSITLTPGTVSVSMEGDNILVHALLSDTVSVEDFDKMAKRSAHSVGDKVEEA